MMKRMTVVLLFLSALGMAWAQNAVTEVKVATDPVLGKYLTDSQGNTLYIFLNDTHLSSHCYGACSEAWPPFAGQGELVAGSGVKNNLLGTLTRDDGRVQVTYNRYPLYLSTKDTEPGMMAGQDIEDTWYIISPDGYRVASGVENSN